MQDERVPRVGSNLERLKCVTLAMAFTEEELHRLRAKAAENSLELDEYANDVLRKMLDETRLPSAGRVQAD